MTDSQIKPSDYLVLICDDEESIRSMLGEAVSSWGFQVATSPNAESALEYIHEGHIPHILLTDIRMGDMNGMELSAEVKKISNEIEVIIMTSHGTFETAVQAMRIGVFDYISKPFDDIDDVKTTLLHVAERIYLKFYSEFLFNEVQEKNREVELLFNISTELSQNLDLAKTLEIGVRGISQAFLGSPTVYIQYAPAQKALLMAARSPMMLFGETQVKFLIPEDVNNNPESISSYISALGSNPEFLLLLEQSWTMNPESMPAMPPIAEGEIPQWRVEPLVTRGIPRGIFACLAHGWREEESPFLLKRYLQAISTSFENSLLHAKVVQTAIRDSLTGLYNVRFFKERFTSEIQQALRLGHPLSLLFLDVDHFKHYNDTHGHPAGDVVLKMVADAMRLNFRLTDVLARYGGEEFVILMPHTAFLDALEKAESFRAYIEKAAFPNEGTQPLGRLTVSIGVSEFPSHGSECESVIKAADDALYEAKKKSRNLVVPGVPAESYVPPFKSQPVRSRNLPKPPTKKT